MGDDMPPREDDGEPVHHSHRRHDDPPDSRTMPAPVVALARSMDFKIPMWGVLLLLGGLAYWLITMDLQQKQILSTMSKVETTVQAGNNQLAATAGEVAIMKFRMEKLEADHVRMLGEYKHKD